MCYRQAIEWKCADCGKKSRENSSVQIQCPNSGCRKVQPKLRPQMRFSPEPCQNCQPRKRRARSKKLRVKAGGRADQVSGADSPHVLVIDLFDADDERRTVTEAGADKKQSQLGNEMESKVRLIEMQHSEHQMEAVRQSQEHRVARHATTDVHLASPTRVGGDQGHPSAAGEHQPLALRPRRGDGICRIRDAVQERHGASLSAHALIALNNWLELV
ncbi:uncharacterized protein Z520_01993 [Fonsecaea multimorphosa CBS 102226]|uniref:Uncharacterized protein n=1 Tax=Fonsecaea multimorphosa CBS 102226 TaxID=1442371 RepID=A0A0D2KET8_9EURO|nr:uncharacterized protein Z520_01993 [Fonsecaea multimorphosa CBS 102226]KIY01855.1 hypothetical protein Z520_01993 [Fonsecaea multimorphosa CBS 102226]